MKKLAASLVLLILSTHSSIAAQSPPDRSAVRALEDAFVEAIAKAEPSVVAIARVRSLDGETKAIAGTLPQTRLDVANELQERRAAVNRGLFLQPGFVGEFDDSPDNLEFDYGSGVVVGSEGRILTAFHVVKGARKLKVRAAGRQEFEAAIIAADARADLAVIVPNLPPGDVAELNLPPIPLGDSTKLRKGSFLIALGNPYNAARDGNASAAWGILANIARRIEPPRSESPPPSLSNYPMLLQLDAKLNLGMSGAAVVNLDGELVGLTTSAGDPEGFDPRAGYAIPMDRLGRRAVASLIEGLEVEYGFLGIFLSTPNTPGFISSKSNVVSGVTAGTPADLAGLVTGDEIISVGDYPVFDSDTLIIAVGSFPVGSVVKVRIRRDDRVLEKRIPLSKFPNKGPVIATNRPKPWRGIRVDYTSTLADSMGRELFEAMAKSPVAIVEVTPESAADQAGLRKGKLVLKVGDKAIRSPADFMRAVANAKGDVVIATESGDVKVHADSVAKPSRRSRD